MTSTKPEDVFKGVFSQQSFNFSLKQLSNWRALYCSNDLLQKKKEDFLADICFQMLKILILRQTLFSQKRQGSSTRSQKVLCKQNCLKSFVTRDRVVVDVKMFVIEIPYCFKPFSGMQHCTKLKLYLKRPSTELFHMFFKHSFSLNYSLDGIYVKMKRTMIFTSKQKRWCLDKDSF